MENKGKKARIKFVPVPNGEARNNYANIDKASARFGYFPKYSIETGLDKYIGWYKKEGSHAI